LVGESQPDIKGGTTRWIGHTHQPHHEITQRTIFLEAMPLDQIIQDYRMGIFMKENYFIHDWAAMEDDLLKVNCPILGRVVIQYSRIGELHLAKGKWGNS
jgi:hypothetical protein